MLWFSDVGALVDMPLAPTSTPRLLDRYQVVNVTGRAYDDLCAMAKVSLFPAPVASGVDGMPEQWPADAVRRWIDERELASKHVNGKCVPSRLLPEPPPRQVPARPAPPAPKPASARAHRVRLSERAKRRDHMTLQGRLGSI